MKRAWNAKELAARLPISERTVLRHLRDGKLTGVKLGKAWIITRSDLAAYLGSDARVKDIFGAPPETPPEADE